MNRRHFLLLAALPFAAPSFAVSAGEPFGPPAPPKPIDRLLTEAAALDNLKVVMVAHKGTVVAERGYHGNRTDRSTNIKSASKSVMSALVGIAIDKGVLTGVDQPIAPLLARDLPANPDPRLNTVTIGNLLSMQSGIQPMSGPNYGRWISSRNWVREALAAPFVDQPGGGMLYSTASTHLLSAILTRTTGKPTLALAKEWLGPLQDFRIGGWERDPQGIYMGGNQMALTPRGLLSFGELYRMGGVLPDGTRLVSSAWIAESFKARTHSIHSGDGYGYGWFEREIEGETVHYGWGYGGQMLYIVPARDLTVVMTSDEGSPSAATGYRDSLHALLGNIIKAVRVSS